MDGADPVPIVFAFLARQRTNEAPFNEVAKHLATKQAWNGCRAKAWLYRQSKAADTFFWVTGRIATLLVEDVPLFPPAVAAAAAPPLPPPSPMLVPIEGDEPVAPASHHRHDGDLARPPGTRPLPRPHQCATPSFVLLALKRPWEEMQA
ncbi:hypothetical protein HKX48_001271, partial [Thoreauomyces humboldtii]